MPSSARWHSPQLRSHLALTAVALAALAVTLLLTFASTAAPPSPSGNGAGHISPERAVAVRAAQPTEMPAIPDDRQPLRTLLVPWTFAVDAIAVLGLAAAYLVRIPGRRRRTRP